MKVKAFILSMLFIVCIIQVVAQSPSDSILDQKLNSFKKIKTRIDLDSAKSFIENNLDFSTIENTPYWKPYIQYWVSFYLNFVNSQDAFSQEFVPAAKRVIDKTKGNNSATALHLANDLIEFFDQYAFDMAAASIAAYANYEIDVPGDKYSEIASRILTADRLSKGEKVPAIEGVSSKGGLKNTIIIFYDRDCGMCTWQIEQLVDKYDLIKSKGYDVISIAADTDPKSFEEYAKVFPWSNKLCDFKSLEGNNFKNYGIISTPMIYLTDQNGIITGKYAKFEQVPLFNDK